MWKRLNQRKISRKTISRIPKELKLVEFCKVNVFIIGENSEVWNRNEKVKKLWTFLNGDEEKALIKL